MELSARWSVQRSAAVQESEKHTVINKIPRGISGPAFGMEPLQPHADSARESVVETETVILVDVFTDEVQIIAPGVIGK
jgi:hypothetical protein